MAAQYVLGIDLGTTNSVLGYAWLDQDDADVRLLKIPQLVAAGVVESRSALPSFAYLASEQEAQGGGLDLPWASGRQFAVGELARRQGADFPQRTVAAAKSWLCHSRVDRREPILPWNAPGEVDKTSPVAATRLYLEHLAAAWNQEFPDAPLSQQQIVLTVPASFDAAARELTREAALSAGLPDDLVLLEEPQAAVYSWIANCGDKWRKHLRPGDKLLVCDVGGGTTDLTLIEAAEGDGGLELERLAVGNHLLVGGDNMDLALAHHVAGLFAEKDIQLDAWQSVSLWHSCRAAKESLLAADGPDAHTISVLGRGSKVIGGTISVEAERKAATELLMEGFVPICRIDEQPQRKAASGFQELGLPFESDAAITRHLAAFLNAHWQAAGATAPPSHVLFNGGVFNSDVLRKRVLETLQAWSAEEESTRELADNVDLDHAVARGAAYYGWAKQHGGVRIRGGVARSYYVGVETAGLAIPGAVRPLSALCVVPFGMEEGTAVDVPSAEIGLILGEPVHFRFFSSACRPSDQPGDVLPSCQDADLVESDSLETVLEGDGDDEIAPVRFHARITELGMLELWCVSAKSERRWKLEFNVRETEEAL